ncbi:uncharacterized protein [Cicer arietinum]|uniref:Uncharacterized protein LOC101497431 n=1 Tax=Cicer arietinum TaxID=3827 RepID=A0A3Q7XSZ4_CICAR|nr:uncharacterized protein LOC101497431 [Cicer arietinum]XP_027191004.1 uncharacterized protein LOC101497431 [Cicer arietinum]XP_027191005.1 uncharacterized protein LOC101497431 [Cicer arietinum]XP_027191006.1 uncharacterized protein LOC101497431 [Cicer arietinum]
MTLDHVTEPVAVPFNWENIRGRPKGKINCDKGLKDEKLKKLEEDDDDDDDDDVYSDALETLSSTESLSMKCSESGLDNLDANKCRSKTSSTDKQSQDFMMNRFLPAAKAMTLKPPQHAPRKQQSVLLEQPSTKLVSEEKKTFVDIIPYTDQYQEEEQEEESGHETDDYTNTSAKGCGLFPSSCIKNSLCLLNQIPETKMENQISMWSYEVEKPNKSSHFSSYRSGPTIKKAWDAIHKSKSRSGASSPDMHETRKLNQLSRLSSVRRSGTAAAAGISSFQSKPQSPFQGARMFGDSKHAENNQFRKLKFQSQEHASFQEVQSQVAKRRSNSKDQEINQESMSLQLVQSSFEKDTKINNKQIVVVDGLQKTDAKCGVMHLLSPPLPKSPSESWLCRALPLVSSKNSFRYSSQGIQSNADKRLGFSRASSYSKWETIVKTSNLHHDHEFCSQELTIYKSQHSKS